MEQDGQLPHFREEGVAGGGELQLALPLGKLQWYHTLHLLSLLLLAGLNKDQIPAWFAMDTLLQSATLCLTPNPTALALR